MSLCLLLTCCLQKMADPKWFASLILPPGPSDGLLSPPPRHNIHKWHVNDSYNDNSFCGRWFVGSIHTSRLSVNHTSDCGPWWLNRKSIRTFKLFLGFSFCRRKIKGLCVCLEALGRVHDQCSLCHWHVEVALFLPPDERAVGAATAFHALSCFMSSMHCIYTAQQIWLIFIVVLFKWKLLREESKGKATNNLLTLCSIPFLFCHVCRNLKMPKNKCCFGERKVPPTLPFFPKRLI